jgi:hypothetical protein
LELLKRYPEFQGECARGDSGFFKILSGNQPAFLKAVNNTILYILIISLSLILDVILTIPEGSLTMNKENDRKEKNIRPAHWNN